MAKGPEIRYINAYVSGNIAYQIEQPVRNKKRVRLPKPRQEKKTMIAVDPIAVGSIVVAALLMVLLVAGFVRLQDARAKTIALERYVSSLRMENQQLKDTYASGYDLDEIEQIAQAMGMVPASQVQQISLSVTVPEKIPEPTAWESFCAFLTGLFA